jgi:hypothetical protein
MCDESFRTDAGPAVLRDPEVRATLTAAILTKDAALFRTTQLYRCPELVGQRQLFGVVSHGPCGLESVFVTQDGEQVDGRSIIEAGTPIHMQNAEITPP